MLKCIQGNIIVFEYRVYTLLSAVGSFFVVVAEITVFEFIITLHLVLFQFFLFHSLNLNDRMEISENGVIM